MECESSSRARPGGELTSEERHAFAHAEQAVTAVRVPRPAEQCLTVTVVVDVDRDRIRAPLNHHVGVRARGMLDDVRQGFLNDSKGT